MIEFTQEEIQMVLEHRAREAFKAAYNEGLRDAYQVMVDKIPAGVQRDDATNIVKSLQKT